MYVTTFQLIDRHEQRTGFIFLLLRLQKVKESKRKKEKRWNQKEIMISRIYWTG